MHLIIERICTDAVILRIYSYKIMNYSNKFNKDEKFVTKSIRNIGDLQRESDIQFLIKLGLTKETIEAIENPITYILNDWSKLGL